MARSFIILILAAVAAAGGSEPAPTMPPSEPSGETAPSVTGSGPDDVLTPAEPKPSQLDKAAEPVKPEPTTPGPKAELLTAETSAWEAAKPTFMKYCATCHTKAGKKASNKKLGHFDMDTYPFGGHHAQTVGFTIRDVLGISGKKPTMPYDKPGSVKGDELAVIKAWSDAWEAAEHGGAHPPVEGHHH
jgi:hypothetical protein